MKQRINYDKVSEDQTDASFKVSFYTKYFNFTKEQLRKNGIIVCDFDKEGIDSLGTPTRPVYYFSNIEMLPLRKNERAIYTIKCRNHIFGFPFNGISVRYLYIDENSIDLQWLKIVCERIQTSILSICSDGQELYFLCENGQILSTSENWKIIDAFDPINERLGYASVFTREALAAEKEKRLTETKEGNYGILAINGNYDYFYDVNDEVFFVVSTFGSYSEGYEVSYCVIQKQSVLKELSESYHDKLFYLAKDCYEGRIPDIALVNSLPEKLHEKYKPPVEVGSGYMYV